MHILKARKPSFRKTLLDLVGVLELAQPVPANAQVYVCVHKCMSHTFRCGIAAGFKTIKDFNPWDIQSPVHVIL